MKILRSIGAVLAGFIAVVALSLVTDHVLHITHVYPPYGEPMHDPALNALALAYRSVYAVIGGWITAKLAPDTPVRHAFILAIIGALAGWAGVIGTANLDLGPRWYPIALAITSPLLTWAGGFLGRR